jgi:hypothetical protein
VPRVDPKMGPDVPENIVELIKEVGLFVPTNMSPEEAQVYNRGVTGHCMTCGALCADTTMVTLNRAGAIMIYCGGACYSDMQVMGWLVEQHGDIVQTIQFRGGSIDPDLPKHGGVEGSD